MGLSWCIFVLMLSSLWVSIGFLLSVLLVLDWRWVFLGFM